MRVLSRNGHAWCPVSLSVGSCLRLSKCILWYHLKHEPRSLDLSSDSKPFFVCPLFSSAPARKPAARAAAGSGCCELRLRASSSRRCAGCMSTMCHAYSGTGITVLSVKPVAASAYFTRLALRYSQKYISFGIRLRARCAMPMGCMLLYVWCRASRTHTVGLSVGSRLTSPLHHTPFSPFAPATSSV